MKRLLLFLALVTACGIAYIASAERSWVSPGGFINEYLVDSEGSASMVVDGSQTGRTFSWRVPDGRRAIIGRMVVYLTDDVTFTEHGFGGLEAGLANGVAVFLDCDTLTRWRMNCDLLGDLDNATGTADVYGPPYGRAIRGSFMFSSAGQGSTSGILLNGGCSFTAMVQDDLIGLDEFRVKINGIYF